jgi:hypothetical protein
MPTDVADAIVNRLDPEVAAAVLSCADVLVCLTEQDQRMAVAILMTAVRLGELEHLPRSH